MTNLHGWIPVWERLPDDGRDVLVLEDGRQFTTWYNVQHHCWSHDDCDPTHWHELLPEPEMGDDTQQT